METEALKRKRRTPPWLIGGLVLILLIMLVSLQSTNLWKSFSVETAGDSLLLFALSSLNFVAFIIFAFILLRSLLKLSRERRELQIGAKIKTRLLVYFIGLSILPIIAMALFSYNFWNRAVERWFSQIPENAAREALNAQISRQNEMAAMLAQLLQNQSVDDNVLTSIAEAGNLMFVQLRSPDSKVLAESRREIDGPAKTELDQKLADSEFISAPLPDGRKLVIVPYLQLKNQFGEAIKNPLTEFDRLKNQQFTIRQIGLSTLGLLTFLLIFAATWSAFYVARGFTTPIKALAEGADELAKGNFAYRVDVLAEDELAILVDAFNQMSSTLEANSIERKERQRYIETVLETLSTGVVSFDSSDRVTTINKTAIQMLRLENDQFKGLQLAELVGSENHAVLEKLINRAKRIGQATEQTALMREQSDGNLNAQSIPVALTASALPDQNGVVLVIEDLTELLQAQRASAWQEVARRMAHEIKNPLTPIQLSAERIAKRFDTGHLTNENLQLTKVVKESTATIIREVSALKSMVDEFSRFARLPTAKPEHGDINELVVQSVALYQDRGVEITMKLGDEMPQILVDSEQMRRVFVNLIENSIEAFDKSQPQKTIEVSTRNDVNRGLIVIEVSDNGSGIAAADFPRLFQPYFSTKGRGTGLGLAIVQRIVAEHGGKIRALQNLPKGARFIVELPSSV